MIDDRSIVDRRISAVTVLLCLLVAVVAIDDRTAIAKQSTAISSGGYFTCALTTVGAVKCWGANGLGQVGDGTTVERLKPVGVSGISSGAVAIAAGGSHACALTISGGVKCWGSNGSGQLGDGTTTDSRIPVDVTGMSSGIASIAAGAYHTCAITTSGGAKCWGANFSGQLGDGTTTDRLFPVDVSGLTSGIASIAALEYHTCAVTISGAAKCWGENQGMLGDGTRKRRLVPVDVLGLGSGVEAITGGAFFTCALTTSGGVKCWGYNGYGQLGDGSRANHRVPHDVLGLTSGVAMIDAGGSTACALTVTGGVECWGSNKSGGLGTGSAAATRSKVPRDVWGLTSGVAAISVSEAEDVGSHGCAMTSTGALHCWGANSLFRFFERGGIGDGTTFDRHVPVNVWSFLGTAPASARPDGQISAARAGPFRGDDVYNLNGWKQTLRMNLIPGATARFFVRLENDGASPDHFFLSAPRGPRRFKIQFLRRGVEITQEIRRGTYWIAVGSGMTKGIHIRITARAHATFPPGIGVGEPLRIESGENSKLIDVVRAAVTVN
jgi:alpha-tubulin suppressor-like RCC1 family protein